jgi:hypothetical protein
MSEAPTIVLVTAVGAARGSKAAAAALACAGSEPDRAALLIDLTCGPMPRPSLIATAAARTLEERLRRHLPDAGVASRCEICQLALPADQVGVERLSAALPLVRDSVAVLHLPPHLLQRVLLEPRIRPSAALLRAELAADRALAALVAGDLIARGVRVSVLKQPLGWLAARISALGVGVASFGLSRRLSDRLLQ